MQTPEPSPEPSPEPCWTWPGACTSAHRSYSGLKTPLAYAVGEKEWKTTMKTVLQNPATTCWRTKRKKRLWKEESTFVPNMLHAWRILKASNSAFERKRGKCVLDDLGTPQDLKWRDSHFPGQKWNKVFKRRCLQQEGPSKGSTLKLFTFTYFTPCKAWKHTNINTYTCTVHRHRVHTVHT